jgi:hypothetical protein
VAVALWVIASVGLVLLTDGPLPVQRTGDAVDAITEVVDAQLNLVVALVLVAIALLVTARRPRVDLAARAPERRTAAVETAALLGYGGAVTLGGLVIGRLAGDHAISLHLPGTIHGLHGDTLAAGWVALWAGYNLVMWAVIPFAVMRARGYTLTQLNLRSANVRADAVLIVVILVLESAIELTLVSGDLFGLSPATLALGIPLAFAVNMLGTVLPVMIFIYAILLPRFARLTGSTTTTVLLGGAAYALIHLFESWAVWTSVGAGLTTVILLFFQYFGPGVIKSVLTVRTGNAWVHVWAYHAVAPHVTLDTVNVLDSLDLR